MKPQSLESNVIGNSANGSITNKFSVSPQNVQDELRKFMLVDGFDITIDLEKSSGSYLYDSKHKRNLLDFFTFVASHPLGMNHPKLNNESFIKEIGKIAVNKSCIKTGTRLTGGAMCNNASPR